MSNNDKLKIKLRMTSCVLPPLVIEMKDERYYRLAAEEVPKILATYQEKYKELSKDVHYHMTMVHFAANMFYLMEHNDSEELRKGIRELTNMVEETLKNK